METERADAIKRAFGDRVREVHLSRGVSQERLALLSGINRVYMGRTERGKQSVGQSSPGRRRCMLRAPSRRTSRFL